MIHLYLEGNTNYIRNGDIILSPTKCTVREKAGGSYELSMTHPIDDAGKWQALQPELIIKAPVPPQIIKNAFAGMDADIYVTNSGAVMREGTSEPIPITYQQWVYGSAYSVGDKVSYGGNNYQCKYWDGESPQMLVPPNANNWWVRIANQTSGSPVLQEFKTGTELIYIRTSGNWYYMSTWMGIEGYVKQSDVTFSRHISASAMKDREITEQLFRIYSVTKQTNDMSVNVQARHVSYDLDGVIMGECKITRKGPPMAIMMMQNSWMIDYQGSIGTNLSTDQNGTYTGNLTGKNGIYGYMDPDKGMVRYFAAQLKRDNWDIFIMANDIEDRGVQIKFGKNLRGVTWKQSTDGLITRVVPVAKNEDGTDLYLSGKWVDSPDIDDYPVIRMEMLRVNGQVGRDDGTDTDTKWTEAALKQEMQEKAEERFSVDHVDAILTEVTVDFALLGDTDEYKQYKNLQFVSMYDRILAEDERIGLSMPLQVSEIEWDAIRQRYTAIKVGNLYDYGGRTVSGYKVGEGAIYYEKIHSGTVDRIREEAVDDTQVYIDLAKRQAQSTAYNNVLAYLRQQGIIT